MTRGPADVVATFRPDTLNTAAMKDTLLAHDTVAYALVPLNRRHDPVAVVARSIVEWTGRVGTTHGRKTWEQHFLRPVPYWRSDGLTDIVLLDANHLGINGLSLMFDAAAAASVRLWLICNAHDARPDVLQWLTAWLREPFVAWPTVEDHWAQRAACAPLRPCPAVGDRRWLTAPPPVWPDTTKCVTHPRGTLCVRDGVRHAVARSEITSADARACIVRLFSTLTTDEQHQADVDLGVDVYRAAEGALGRAGRHNGVPLDPALGAVSSDGAQITVRDGETVAVPPACRPAIERQRAHTLLAGGNPDGPLLTVFGAGGFGS